MPSEEELIAAIREAFWPNDYEGAFWSEELQRAAKAVLALLETKHEK